MYAALTTLPTRRLLEVRVFAAFYALFPIDSLQVPRRLCSAPRMLHQIFGSIPPLRFKLPLIMP